MNILSVIATGLMLAAFELPIGYEASSPESLLDHEPETTAVGVPEPSTIALGALGLFGVAAIRRRKFLASRTDRTA